MAYYNSFKAEAMELSQKLPEEQNELYKRHFIPMPLDEFAKKIDSAKTDPAESAALKSMSARLSRNFNIKFDAVIGGTEHLVMKKTESLRVVGAEDLTEGQLAGKMYRSSDDKLIAFVHAHAKRFVLINIPDGGRADLRLLFVNTDAPLAAQVLVNVGAGAELNLVEWYASAAGEMSMMCTLHEITLGKYAKSEMSAVHNEDAHTYALSFSKGRVGEGAELNLNYVYNGGLNSRSKSGIISEGYAAKSNVSEAVMGSEGQKFDLNTIIANTGRDTVSDLESKAALMGDSVCLLKGFADVGIDASGSRSFVNERGILLDPRAYISSMPGMSIKNSNVKATHSSATAPVDAESLFYLMSRGTDKVGAEKLLVSGFFSGSIAKIRSPEVKAAVASLMNEKIKHRRFGVVPALDTDGVWFDSTAVGHEGIEGHYKYRDMA